MSIDANDPRRGSFATGSSRQTADAAKASADKARSSSSSSSGSKSPGATKTPSSSSSGKSKSTPSQFSGNKSFGDGGSKSVSKPSGEQGAKKTQQSSSSKFKSMSEDRSGPSASEKARAQEAARKAASSSAAAGPGASTQKTVFAQQPALSSAAYNDLASSNTYSSGLPGEMTLLDQVLGRVPSDPRNVFYLPPVQGPSMPAPGERDTSIAERYASPLTAFERAMGINPLRLATLGEMPAPAYTPQPAGIPMSAQPGVGYVPGMTTPPQPRPYQPDALGGLSVAEFNASLPPEAAFLPDDFAPGSSPAPEPRPAAPSTRPSMRPPQVPGEMLPFTQPQSVYGEPITPYTTRFDAPIAPGALEGVTPGSVPGAPSVPEVGGLPQLGGAPPAPPPVQAAPDRSFMGPETISDRAAMAAAASGLPVAPPDAMASSPVFFTRGLNAAEAGSNAGPLYAFDETALSAPAFPELPSLETVPVGGRTTLPPPRFDGAETSAPSGLTTPALPGGAGGPSAVDDRYAPSVPGDELRLPAPTAGSLPAVQGPAPAPPPPELPARSFMGPDTASDRASVAERFAPQMALPGRQGIGSLEGGPSLDDFTRMIEQEQAYVRDQELRRERPVPRPAVPAPDRGFMGPDTVSDRAAAADRMRPEMVQYLQTDPPRGVMDNPFFDALPEDLLPPLPVQTGTLPSIDLTEPTETAQLAAERAAQERAVSEEARRRIAEMRAARQADPLAQYDFGESSAVLGATDLSQGTGLGGMGLQASSSGSSLAPTAANIAADTAASAGDIPEGAFAPAQGAPTSLGGMLLAGAANAVNPLLRGQDTGEGGLLRRITGGRPLFGEDGIIPPSDPYTIEQFMADQAEMDRGSDRERQGGGTGSISDFVDSVADGGGTADGSSISSGQPAAISYVDRPGVMLPSGYGMSLEEYLAMLQQMPGGAGAPPSGLLTVTPLNLGIGSLV